MSERRAKDVRRWVAMARQQLHGATDADERRIIVASWVTVATERGWGRAMRRALREGR